MPGAHRYNAGMSKKILIPLIILAVLGATGLGIFIASSQSAQPGSPQTSANASSELSIGEIDRVFTLPEELGAMTYQMNGPISALLYSDSYETLEGCAGKHIAELQLSNTESDFSIPIGGQYKYAMLILQPMGLCGADEGERLADALSGAILKQ